MIARPIISVRGRRRPQKLLQLLTLFTTNHLYGDCFSFKASNLYIRISRLHAISASGNDDHDHEHEAWLKKRGMEKYRLDKMARKDKRIASLESRKNEVGENLSLSENEKKELNGLMNAGSVWEEQYTTSEFTKEHIMFKDIHNQVFVSLVQYVQAAQSTTAAPINIFYLDGPDAGTSLALLRKNNNDDDEIGHENEYRNGFVRPEQCYIANRHGSTCETLTNMIPGINVAYASAADALSSRTVLVGEGESNTSDDDSNNDSDDSLQQKESAMGVFGNIPFSALYLDGCGGYIPLIIDMINAAFDHYTPLLPDDDVLVPYPIAIGFSVLGGNRDVVDKEQDVIRELVSMIKRRGLRLRVDHVLDDPERYGISPELNVRKVDGGTMTTWVMLERDDTR